MKPQKQGNARKPTEPQRAKEAKPYIYKAVQRLHNAFPYIQGP